MKILLIHYRYYLASGPERYLFNIKSILEKEGHLVIPFSINYEENVDTPYKKYFVEPIGDKSQFHIQNQEKQNNKDRFKLIANLFYNKEAYIQLDNLIKNEKPDIAYVLQFWGKLSTSIFDACKKQHLPVILRLSDYNLLCQKNIFYLNGKVCTKCLKTSFHAVLNRCTHNSYIKSFVNYTAYQFNYLKKFQSNINAIITPSGFTKNIFENNKHFKKTKFYHLPTPIMDDKIAELENVKRQKSTNFTIGYFGRIDPDKGIKTLLDAAVILKDKGFKLEIKIIGDLKNEYAIKMLEYAKQSKLKSVDFPGFKSAQELKKELSYCDYTVIPSVWYDNMPNSLIESMAMGIPVIASDIGSFKELIIENRNGLLFNPGDPNDLAQKIMYAHDQLNRNELSEFSVNWVKEYCSQTLHYESLMEIFQKEINAKKDNE